MSCGTVEECIRGLLPSLFVVRLQCPDEVRAAEHIVSDLLLRGASMCTNATLHVEMASAFESGGTFFGLAACATRAMSFDQMYVSFLAWAPFRALICGPPPIGLAGALPTEGDPSMRPVYAAAVATALFTLGVVTSRVGSLSTQRHRLLIACWLVLLVACIPPLRLRSQAMDVDGLFYRDELTSCALDFQRALPHANVRNRVTSVVAPVASLPALYERMRTMEVGNASLRSVCGHCSLYAFGLTTASGLNEHLILNRTPDRVDEVGIANVMLPAHVPRQWAEEWTARLRPLMSSYDGAAFTNLHQAELDLAESISVDGGIYVASLSLTLFALCVAVYTYTRNVVASLCIASGVTFVVVASIAIGDAACALVRLPRSPYNAVISPVILGTGVDSALILMHAFRQTKGLDHAWPSIMASQATTLLSFAMGVLLPVAHIQNFFVHSMATLLISFLMQAAFFSYIARHATYALTADEGPSAPPAYWKWSAAGLVGCWLVMLPSLQPIRVEFNMQNQISEQTLTYAFLQATSHSSRGDSVPMYAFLKTLDTNWTDLNARMSAVDATPVFDWHADYVASGSPNISAWKATPSAQLMFNAFVSPHSGANAIYANLDVGEATAGWGFDDTSRYVNALQLLERERAPGLCFASFDLMDGYTLTKVLAVLWVLGLGSCCVCTLFAIGIARHHGLACFATLGMSYAFGLAAMAALRIKVHMMIIAVFLVAPGLLTDYIMHMTYNADTKSAVAWSALISVLSIVPYVASPSRGVRDFSVAYIIFVASGLMHAFVTTCTRSIPYFMLRRPPSHVDKG